MKSNKRKIKVLLATSSFGALDKIPIRKLEEAGFEVMNNPYKRKLKKEELFSLLPEIEGIIAGLETLDREVMAGSKLKVISRCGSGLSNVDLEGAKELGIAVRSTPQGPVLAVAELTVGCLLSLLRQVSQMDQAMHERKWKKMIGRQLFGMTVAIVGFGNIGRKVAEMLRALGARVIAVDPRLSGMIEGIPVVKLDEALKQADALTLHCSGEKCLLGEKEFDLMKKGVFLLNAARGSLIDEKSLVSALNSGKVAGVWLDTFWDEPYNGRVCDYTQVILTPHVGSYTVECRKQMELEAVENLIEAFKSNEKQRA